MCSQYLSCSPASLANFKNFQACKNQIMQHWSVHVGIRHSSCLLQTAADSLCAKAPMTHPGHHFRFQAVRSGPVASRSPLVLCRHWGMWIKLCDTINCHKGILLCLNQGLDGGRNCGAMIRYLFLLKGCIVIILHRHSSSVPTCIIALGARDSRQHMPRLSRCYTLSEAAKLLRLGSTQKCL